MDLTSILRVLWLSSKLKDLEKLGPKKGVISQSVKDVIQSLVDDDLVFKDKIGTSVSHPQPSGKTCLQEF